MDDVQVARKEIDELERAPMVTTRSRATIEGARPVALGLRRYSSSDTVTYDFLSGFQQQV